MTDDEALLKEVALLPAPYCNRVFIQIVEGQGVRLSFAEQTVSAGIVIGRAAVILSPDNTLQLKNLIDLFIKKLPSKGLH